MEVKRIKLEANGEQDRLASAATSTSPPIQEAPHNAKSELSPISDPSTCSTSPALSPNTTRSSPDDVNLTPEQEQVLTKAKQGHNVFFTGSAGTGKSLLLRRIIQYFEAERNMNRRELVVAAPTGRAAMNIGGGTIHAWAGIGIDTDSPIEDLLCKIMGWRRYYEMSKEATDASMQTEDIGDLPTSMQRWVQCRVLIIDEISMINDNLYDKLERMARFIRRNAAPFGGIQLIMSEDFLQLPPIVKRPNIPRFAFQSDSWGGCISEPIVSSRIHRQHDRAFIDVLNDVRYGEVTSSVDSFIHAHAQPVKYEDGFTPTDLCATRYEVDRKNSAELAKINGPSRIFSSEDSFYWDMEDTFTAPKKLELKVKAHVMLLQNLVPNVLVNGSLGEVIDFSTSAKVHESQQITIGVPFALAKLSRSSSYAYQKDEDELNIWLTDQRLWPVVRFKCGDSRRESVDVLCVPRRFVVRNPDGYICREQVPLTLAYALTIHKAQGQTLERVRVDLGRTFEFGQCYVALSRAVSADCLEIINWTRSAVKAHPVAVEWYNALKMPRRTENGHFQK